MTETLTRLAHQFQRFGERECLPASPLYARLAVGIAGDEQLLRLAAAALARPVPDSICYGIAITTITASNRVVILPHPFNFIARSAAQHGHQFPNTCPRLQVGSVSISIRSMFMTKRRHCGCGH